MLFLSNPQKCSAILLLSFSAATLLAPVLRSKQSGAARQEKAPEPWTDAQVLHARDLAREIGSANDGSAPTIVYVGFRTLYEGGHVPEASFHGTASKNEGLAEFKIWAATLPRSANLVIYCGCCPFDRCPNIRPAYTSLHEMGFAHVRVLVLPTSFAADWVEKGYRIEKGR